MVVAEAALGLLLAVKRLLLRLPCREGLAAFLAGSAPGAECGYRVDLLVAWVLQLVECPGSGTGDEVSLVRTSFGVTCLLTCPPQPALSP